MSNKPLIVGITLHILSGNGIVKKEELVEAALGLGC